MPALSDHECLAILVARPRDSDAAERAVATLFERYDRRLQCHLRCRFSSLNDDDVCELAQEAWLRVWRRLDDQVRAEAFRGWLYRIGDNLAIDLIRKKGTRAETPMGEREIAAGAPNHVHELDFAQQLRRCVEKLPERLQELLRRLLNLETFDEIEAATGQKKSRIYQLKHEVGKLLLGCLEQAS